MGMSQDQIEAVARTKAILPLVSLVAPASGFIVWRNVSADQRFEKGADFYRIVDLNRVWILADIFESDAAAVQPGTLARLCLPHAPGTSLMARVSDTVPQFEATTRTLKVRLEADNSGLTLKPDMYVDLQLSRRLSPGLSVPIEAVLDSGLRKVVYVECGSGCFEPRQVQTGWQSGGRAQIVSGLSAGERIVTTGNFLLDSESRMQTARNSVPHD
jgi:RND family efflux transporter MFP subunit